MEIFQENFAWPCSITMPTTFAQEKAGSDLDNVTYKIPYGGFPCHSLPTCREASI